MSRSATAAGCIAHVNLTGHTTIGARTVIHPFASLGSPPQSVHYRGGPTRLVVGAECDIRENVTMNTGTEDGGGVTQVGDRCFLMVGSHVGHDCKVGNNVVFANNILLAGHVSVGDYVVFGGGVAVRQFVRIGEGAMIVGLSGVRADVIPWGTVQGPLANLVGLNVIGMRRRGFAKADIHRYREAYRALFFGDGEFRARLERVAADYGGDAQVDEDDRLHPRRQTAADHGRQTRRGGRVEGTHERRADREPGSAARADLRRRQPAVGGGGFRQPRADARCCCFRCTAPPIRPISSGGRIIGCISGKAANSSRLARAAGCRDVVLIGSLVRPSLLADQAGSARR